MVDTPASARLDTWEIDPQRPGPIEVLADIWRFRWLLRFLASRSLQKIYRRTILGWVWLLIIPLFPIVLRTIIFGALLNVPSNGVPYILFIAAGSLIWDMFASALMWGTRSLEINGMVAEQTYVPRAIIPIGGMAPAALDFVLKLGAFALIVCGIWLWRGSPYVGVSGLGWAAAALAATWFLALGLSFFTSVWGEAGRDTRLILGQVLAVWYLLTPVLYPVSELPERWRPWLALNPLTALVETFRWALFGVGHHDPGAFAISCAVAGAAVMIGLAYFTRMDAAAYEER
jgi:lipopolysaccharide transport system permease protein